MKHIKVISSVSHKLEGDKAMLANHGAGYKRVYINFEQITRKDTRKVNMSQKKILESHTVIRSAKQTHISTRTHAHVQMLTQIRNINAHTHNTNTVHTHAFTQTNTNTK